MANDKQLAHGLLILAFSCLLTFMIAFTTPGWTLINAEDFVKEFNNCAEDAQSCREHYQNLNNRAEEITNYFSTKKIALKAQLGLWDISITYSPGQSCNITILYSVYINA